MSAQNRTPSHRRRPEIQKENFIFADHQVGRIFVIGCQSVPARANDALVPVRRDAVHLFGEFVDFRVQMAFADTGADQSACLDLAEQPLSFGLGGAKFCDSLFFESVYRKAGI